MANTGRSWAEEEEEGRSREKEKKEEGRGGKFPTEPRPAGPARLPPDRGSPRADTTINAP